MPMTQLIRFIGNSFQSQGRRLLPVLSRAQLFSAAKPVACGDMLNSRHLHRTDIRCSIVPFKLSDIGEGITEVTVKEWFVKVGDKVAQFDNICEVQSDKASVTITSRYDGVVSKLHYEVDDTAKVGLPLVDIDVEGETAEADSSGGAMHDVPSDVSNSSSNSSTSLSSHNKALATPAVRRIASEYKVDISTVIGSGKGGRVMKEDILAYISGKQTSIPFQPEQPSSGPVIARPAATSTDKTVSITGYTKAMVKTMTAANAVPHFVYSDEIDVGALIKLRQEMKQVAEKRSIKLTYMPFFLKAVSLALLEFPMLNASVNADCTEVTYKARHNIGFAMDTSNGLVVPNIKDVQLLNVLDIAQESNRLIDGGRKGSLAPRDVTGGTFSMSNIGSIGGTYMKPVLLVPEVTIGALGRFQKLPRFGKTGGVEEANITYVSWAADHRVIDGATVARFSNLFKDLIENPIELII